MKGLHIIRQLFPEVDFAQERDRWLALYALAGWQVAFDGDLILLPPSTAQSQRIDPAPGTFPP